MGYKKLVVFPLCIAYKRAKKRVQTFRPGPVAASVA